jgi:uroporphyrinogen-III synthase
VTRPLVLLRPQPGNDETAARARALGLEVVQLPLFDVVAAEPAPLPDGAFDALLLTSANAARFGAAALARHAALPLYAVGAATAQAARGTGLARILTGGGDAQSTAAMIAAAGHRNILHLCGAEVRPFDSHGLAIARLVVYLAAETPDEVVRPRIDGLGAAVAAVHSPRAGQRLAALVNPAARALIAIAAISPAAARACGDGWAETAIAARPDDTALLQVAEALCSRAG